MGYNIGEDIEILCKICDRLAGGPGGTFKFKDIFYDREAEGSLESLSGTLISAKKRGIVKFDSPLLLQGAHDEVEITFVGPE